MNPKKNEIEDINTTAGAVYDRPQFLNLQHWSVIDRHDSYLRSEAFEIALPFV